MMEKLFTARPPKRKVFHIFDENGKAICEAFSINLKTARFWIGKVDSNYNPKINEPHMCKKCYKMLTDKLTKDGAPAPH